MTVISIGTELLLGETINTNLAFLGQCFNGYGLQIDREVCVGDDLALMRAVFEAELGRSEAVITIGGLGPTADDLTKELAAEILGVGLVVDEASAARVRAKYAERGVRQNDRAVQRQSQLPAGAEPLANDWGTAPGVWWSDDACVLIMLPGPPRELRPMVRERVMPRLMQRLTPREKRLNVTVFGTPESTVEARTMEALREHSAVTPSYCTRSGSCLVRLSVKPADEAQLQPAAEAMLAAFGRDARIHEVTVVAAIAEQLRERGWSLATAESCTGGGIGWTLTGQAGISDIYAGGVVTYSNAMKRQLLGVREATLQAHGAVSEAVAREMALGAAERLGVEAAISVTGIAGPGGGTAAKPVGTVWIGTFVDGDVQATHHLYPYDRQGVRERTISSALNQLRRHILSMQSSPTAP